MTENPNKSGGEVWKPIEGYEDLYEVSSLGRVRSLDREITIAPQGEVLTCIRKGRVLRVRRNRCGYNRVALSREAVREEIFAHILVARAFIPNPLNLPIINHKDCCLRHEPVATVRLRAGEECER